MRYQTSIGYWPEIILLADTDGDGKIEFIVARERFPSELVRFEATGDNTYTKLQTYYGYGGDSYTAGAMDLDGDGAPETVFSDNRYSNYIGRTYVFENDVRVFYSESFYAYSLGDTDGDGLGEIIGQPAERIYRMKILESTGNGNNFAVEFEAVSEYSTRVYDIDGDGQSEFWRAIDTGRGQKDVFTLAHRSGSTITDFYNSGTLLQSFSGDIRWLWPLDDTNGDGQNELAVLQSNQLHIFEVGSSCTIDSLRNEVLNAGLPKGIEQSLLAKLDAADRSYGKYKYDTGNNQLGAFINELEAQKGKHIPAGIADNLITKANCIISKH